MPRAAFTAIELLTVLAVMVIMVGMATPTVMSAMRQSAVNDAAEVIISVANKARQLARLQTTPEADARFGVEIHADSATGRIAATVTYGPSIGDITPAMYVPRSTTWTTYADYLVASPMTGADGQPRPFARTELARTMTVRVNGSPMATPLRWQYQPRSGRVVTLAGVGATVGTASSPICTALEVSSLDGRLRRAVAVYEPGLIAVEAL